MAGFLRWIFAFAMLPLCWGLVRALVDAVETAAGGERAFSAESLALLGGMAAFALCWATLSHPVKAYVLGHELTHALWGLLFLARPTRVRVGASGGSVNLSKTNVLITLAPYFFPFYTFVVALVALVAYLAVGRLPCLPVWLFLVGFTWAFHVLFTLGTLTHEQPDVRLYGRLFSWVLIFAANLVLVLVWLAAATDLSFAQLWDFVVNRVVGAYGSVGSSVREAVAWCQERTVK